jgi:hypothetical protein
MLTLYSVLTNGMLTKIENVSWWGTYQSIGDDVLSVWYTARNWGREYEVECSGVGLIVGNFAPASLNCIS